MRKTHLSVIAMLAAASLAADVTHAQARGPSAADVLDHGQQIVSARKLREQAREEALQRAKEEEQAEQMALQDETIRAARIAALDAWLRRLVGHFRIEGRIAYEPSGPSEKVTGVADCASVGESAGVQCIFNATWHNIEEEHAQVGLPPPPSEMLQTFNPAMLLIGLNKDPPSIRALMVNADSLAHIWVGKLDGNTVRAARLNRCMSGRCIRSLEIIAEPEGKTVTFVLHTIVTLTLTMVRDPEARAKKPLKPLPSR